MENQIETGAEQVQDPVQPVEQQHTESTTEQTVEATEQAAEAPIEFKPEPFQPQQPQQQSFELTPDVVVEKFKGNEKALLQALGYDDFGIEALNYYKQTGDLAAYWEAKSVDYNKLSDEQIMERALREQYASMNLDADELNLLIEDELTSRFKVNDELASERDLQLGRVRLKAEATKLRNQFIERQAQFRAPERVEQQVEETPEITPEQQVQQSWQMLQSDPAVQQFLQSKALKLGDAQNPFTYQSKNPQEMLSLTVDPEYWKHNLYQRDATGNVVADADGSPKWDTAKMMKIAAYAHDMENIERLLVEHGRKLGEKKLMDEAENVQTSQSYGQKAGSDSLWDALERKLG